MSHVGCFQEKQALLKHSFLALSAALYLATSGWAQTAAERYEKGLFNQQTAGNLDAAIEAYRQAIATAGTDRALAGRAQVQLVGTLLQKGDTQGASREFNTFVLNYADQTEMIAKLASVIKAAGVAPTPELSNGTLQNGVYHNTKTGTEVRLPAGWTFADDGNSPSDGGEYALFKDATGQEYFMSMRPGVGAPTSAATIPVALERNYANKIQQRIDEGLTDFTPRAGSKVKFGSGTRQGISGVFDYHTLQFLVNTATGQQDSNGNPTLTATTLTTPMAETDTWIRTSLNLVYFRGIAPPAQQSTVQSQLQTLIDATVIP